MNNGTSAVLELPAPPARYNPRQGGGAMPAEAVERKLAAILAADIAGAAVASLPRRRGHGVRRRSFLVGITGTVALFPFAVTGQQPKAMPVVVMVSGGEPLPGTVNAFLGAMYEAGLEQDHEFGLMFRSTQNDPARRPVLAKEVVGLSPAVIISGDTPLTVELRRATDIIPIVSVAFTDPVGLGLASSLAHPSGNVTGILAAVSAPSKLIELLIEAVPRVVKIGVLYNPTNAGNVMGVNSLKADTTKLPVTLVMAGAGALTDIEPALQRSVDIGVGAFFVSQDALFVGERQRIADFALAARLPMISGFRAHTEAGGLISYGSNFPQRYLLAGQYAAKILKGAKAGDLPIQLQPKLELVINLKTAKALGLDLPRSILARADEVIE